MRTICDGRTVTGDMGRDGEVLCSWVCEWRGEPELRAPESWPGGPGLCIDARNTAAHAEIFALSLPVSIPSSVPPPPLPPFISPSSDTVDALCSSFI